jgi:hypothetical protein
MSTRWNLVHFLDVGHIFLRVRTASRKESIFISGLKINRLMPLLQHVSHRVRNRRYIGLE